MPKVQQVVPINLEESAKGPFHSRDASHSAPSKHLFQTYDHAKKVVKSLVKRVRPQSALDISSSSFDKPFWNTLQSNVNVHYGATRRDYSALDLRTIEARFTRTEQESRPAGTEPVAKSGNEEDEPLDQVKVTRMKKRGKRTKYYKESKEVKDALQEETVPEWIALRESYLDKLELIARQVLLRQNDDDLPGLRQSFLHVIAMIQRITLRIVEFYTTNLSLHHEASSGIYLAEDRWDDIVQYVQTLPTSLNWLEGNPFRLWCGLHLANNPLAAAYDMHNDLAVLLNHDLRQLLASAGELFTSKHILGESLRQPRFISELQAVLAKELRYDLDVHGRIVSANTVLLAVYQASQLQRQQERMRILQLTGHQHASIDLGRHLRLSFLLFGCDKQTQLDGRGEQVMLRSRYYYRKIYYQFWRHAIHQEMCVLVQTRRRQLYFYRVVFNRFVYGVERIRRLQNIRQRALRRHISIALDTWHASILYLKRYRELRRRCILTVLNIMFEQWRENVDEQIKGEDIRVRQMFEWRFHRLIQPCHFSSRHSRVPVSSIVTTAIATTFGRGRDRGGREEEEEEDEAYLIHLEQKIIMQRLWRHWHRRYTISSGLQNLSSLLHAHLMRRHWILWQQWIHSMQQREKKAEMAREEWERSWMDYEESCMEQFLWQEKQQLKWEREREREREREEMKRREEEQFQLQRQLQEKQEEERQQQDDEDDDREEEKDMTPTWEGYDSPEHEENEQDKQAEQEEDEDDEVDREEKEETETNDDQHLLSEEQHPSPADDYQTIVHDTAVHFVEEILQFQHNGQQSVHNEVEEPVESNQQSLSSRMNNARSVIAAVVKTTWTQLAGRLFGL